MVSHRRGLQFAAVVAVSALAVVASPAAAATPCQPASAPGYVAPTDVKRTFIRKGAGEFGAARGSKKHAGVDLLVRASYPEKDAYAVRAISDGTVAYAQMNGSLTEGYGNVIVVDHGADCYVLYAHLASDPFTPAEPGGNLLRKVKDKVKAGDLLAYFVATDVDVDSTGNAHKIDPAARHQVHVEFISAPSGRAGSGTLKDIILKKDSQPVDPTIRLTELGYAIEATAPPRP